MICHFLRKRRKSHRRHFEILRLLCFGFFPAYVSVKRWWCDHVTWPAWSAYSALYDVDEVRSYTIYNTKWNDRLSQTNVSIMIQNHDIISDLYLAFGFPIEHCQKTTPVPPTIKIYNIHVTIFLLIWPATQPPYYLIDFPCTISLENPSRSSFSCRPLTPLLHSTADYFVRIYNNV